MGTLTQIWRYPIKGCGREPLDRTDLVAGTTLPGDRAWAIAHEAAKLTGGWDHCSNFAITSKSPRQQAIGARTNADGTLTMTHPDLAEVTVDLPSDGQKLIDWVTPIWPDNRPALAQVVPAPERGVTDTNYASVSIMNRASLRALCQKSGLTLQARRFRGNIWIDGAAPWEEFDWIGKTLSICDATLEIVEPIERCLSTHANPDTGRRDAEVLRHLNGDWGHQNFGVHARVVNGGAIARGDAIIL